MSKYEHLWKWIRDNGTDSFKLTYGINQAIDWAVTENMQIIYIKHNNLSPGTRTFKPDTKGAELVPEMKVVSDNIFVKTKANALTSEEFTEFIEKNGINEFFIAGADATGCVKSTCFNMTKAGYSVHVISDCVTSYDLKKMDEMYAYYAKKGCEVKELKDYMEGADRPVDDRLAPTETKWRKRVWRLITRRNTKNSICRRAHHLSLLFRK